MIGGLGKYVRAPDLGWESQGEFHWEVTFEVEVEWALTSLGNLLFTLRKVGVEQRETRALQEEGMRL